MCCFPEEQTPEEMAALTCSFLWFFFSSLSFCQSITVRFNCNKLIFMKTSTLFHLFKVFCTHSRKMEPRKNNFNKEMIKNPSSDPFWDRGAAGAYPSYCLETHTEQFGSLLQNHALTCTPRGNLETTIKFQVVSFWTERENPHLNRENIQTPHRKRLWGEGANHCPTGQ